MSLLVAHELGKWFGAEKVFEQISFQVARGDKIALVGANGAGKSTLMKLIAGLEDSTEGSLARTRGVRVTYQAQEARFPTGSTLLQEAHAALGYLSDLEAALRSLEAVIADSAHPNWEAELERYGELQHRYEHAGGYEKEHRIERTLHGLGFRPHQWEQPLEQFSGGQRTRAALALALLGDPDLLLLDEPTNHLDMAALEWLEEFLRSWHGTLIVISHDRYFLDRVTTRTWDMEWGNLKDYAAAYSHYQRLKAEYMEQYQKEYEAQQQFIAKTEEFIRRYKAGQRSKEAKGREKRLNRLKYGWNSVRGFVPGALQAPEKRRELKFNIQSDLRAGDVALAIDALQVGYHDVQQKQTLLTLEDVQVERGERVALLGPNGSGKSTLLRTLVNQLQPIAGNWELGANVQVGYYAQGHEGLNFERTILDEMFAYHSKLGETRIRTILGNFLFSHDDVHKQIKDLSGGERSRVALARLMLAGGNLLILDEPTNHLDIQAREALETVLNEYEGTLIFVSHDRYFIDAVADSLWVVEDQQVGRFGGNYSAWQAFREQERRAAEQQAAQQAQAAKSRPKSPSATENDKDRRELRQLEQHIAQLEARKADLNGAINQAAAEQASERVGELGSEYATVDHELATCYERWAELAESLEAA